MNYLLITMLLGLLILIHELGHFLAARWVGIPVRRFSVGFGPRVWGMKRAETEYWLSAIPLGGYVLPAVEDEHEYFRIPLRKRLAFAAGGPLANLLLPVPLFAAMNVLGGGLSAGGVLVAPVLQTGEMLGRLVASIPQLFARPEAVSGVVGIVVEGGGFIGSDPVRALQFAVLLSLNLAVLNMLPIPMLDGGKIVLHLLEKLHPAATRLYVPLSVLGLVFILGLVVYTTAVDIGRYVL
ncbi:MAG: site-2 protease family protein [Pirellulales bacterium]|nr:site-2 protease family protein [Pirellulales bacterium]